MTEQLLHASPAEAFLPPPWLRNPHAQSMIGGLPLRRMLLRPQLLPAQVAPIAFVDDLAGPGFIDRELVRIFGDPRRE